MSHHFADRARGPDGIPVDGWTRCRCGGLYTLDEKDGAPLVLHNLPLCPRYHAIVTSNDAVKFSEENRAAAAIQPN
ncbi:MAG TPA: hypothetical protein VGK73_04050 [Polyangiaceae bacterium]